MPAELAVPGHGLVDHHRRLDGDRTADAVLDVALAPVGEIMIAAVVLHGAVVVTDTAERRLELLEIAGDGGRQYHLAKGDAIEGVVADDESLRKMGPTDQRVGPIAD